MKDIESQLKKGREIVLTSREKITMRFRLESHMRSYKSSPSKIISPYVVRVDHIWNLQTVLKATALMLIVAIVSAGSITYASEQTLPGDLLYPIKIHVKEELAVSLASTPEKKVNVQKHLIEKRIEEVKELQKSGTLTAKKTETIKETFANNAKDLNKSFDELQADGKEEVVIAVAVDLIPTLTAFKEETDAADEALSKQADSFSLSTTISEDTETLNEDLIENTEIEIVTDTNLEEEKIPPNEDMSSNIDEAITNLVFLEVQKIQAQATESLVAIEEKALAREIALVESPLVTPLEDSGIEFEKKIAVISAPANPDTSTESTYDTFGVSNGNIIFDITPRSTEDTDQPVTSSTLNESEKGTLEGRVILETSCFMQTVFQKCIVDETLYTNRTILIYDGTKTNLISSVEVLTDGTFEVTLPIGKYFVDATRITESETSFEGLPIEIEIVVNQTTPLTLTINTETETSVTPQ